MNKIIKLHSIIDLITNSSTEIFVTCHEKSIDLIKEFINEVLKSVNSDKTADDLFEIKLYMGDEYDKNYENIDFNDDYSPVNVEIISKTNNKDLTKIIYDILEAREFCN